MVIEVAWATDTGLRREKNEDSVLVWRDRARVQVLLVVADGIGGSAAGQVASRLTVDTFARALEEDGLAGCEQERLRNALVRANAKVLQISRTAADLAGMGSTLAAALIDHTELGSVNVGDSSTYLIRGHAIHRLSEDHSLPAELARRGIISDQQVQSHRMKHMLVRAIGQSEDVEGHYYQATVNAGDICVLWTDGIEAAHITAEEVGEWLNVEDLALGVARVIDYCRDRGAPDNVSLVAARLQ